jgi:hypothetical protein
MLLIIWVIVKMVPSKVMMICFILYRITPYLPCWWRPHTDFECDDQPSSRAFVKDGREAKMKDGNSHQRSDYHTL